MKILSKKRWQTAVSVLFLSISPSHGEILFSDSFDDADGTPLPAKPPIVGAAWTQPNGPAMTVQGGAISTVGEARTAFAEFARPFNGGDRVLKMTIDLTFLATNNGYGGISLFDGTREVIFIGDLSGSFASLGMQGPPAGEQAFADPVTLLGAITFTYDYDTGRATIFSGTEISGPVLATAGYSPLLTFDRIRIENGGGGDIGVSEIRVETLSTGAPAVDLFSVTDQITRQGDSPVLAWSTSFADQIAIDQGINTNNDPTGSVALELPSGDTVFKITATDTESGISTSASTIGRSVIGTTLNYRYIRFNTLKTRDPLAGFVQIADLQFFNPTAEVVPVSVTNPGGVNPVPEEGPGSLIDGNSATKWVDDAKAPVIFYFGSAAPSITEYSFVTAANIPGWDPVQWTMEGSMDGRTWTLVENVTAFDLRMPLDRLAPAQIIPFPGPSLIPLSSSFRIVSSVINKDTNQVNLTWESAAGASYRITASENLTDWSPIKSGIAGAAGTTNAVTGFPEAPRQFFRVERE